MDKLKEIVQRMVAAGESEENIALVIKKYNAKPKKIEDTTGKQTSQGQGAPVAGTAAAEIQLTDTVSPSVSGSLESPKSQVETAMPKSLGKDGKLYRTEDVIEYEDSYKECQKNRNSELRAITLKNNGIDIAKTEYPSLSKKAIVSFPAMKSPT